MAVNRTQAQEHREYLNQHAQAIYDSEWARRLTAQLQDFIESNRDWIGLSKSSDSPKAGARLLDYACGFGVVSFALSGHTESTRGIDVTDYMVDSYNKAAKEAGFSAGRMSAVRGNLLEDDDAAAAVALDGPEFRDFDVVVMSLALHHIDDQGVIMRKLVERLKSGGVVVIIDFLKSADDDDAAGAHSHGHHHHHQRQHYHGHLDHNHDEQQAGIDMGAMPKFARSSFSKEDMSQYFRNAGCDEDSFAFRVYHEDIVVPVPGDLSGTHGGQSRKLFMAKARKIGTS